MRSFKTGVLCLAGALAIVGASAAQEVDPQQPFYINEDVDSGVYLSNDAAGERTFLEIWTRQPGETGICVVQAGSARCEEPFSSGFTLRRLPDAVLLETFSDTERFELFRGRYLSLTGPVSYRELTTEGGGDGGLVATVTEWSLGQRAELTPDAPDRFRVEQDGVQVEIRVDGDELRYLVTYDDGESDEILFVSADGRGDRLAAFLPSAPVMPDLRQPVDAVSLAQPARVAEQSTRRLPEGMLPISLAPDGSSILLGSQNGTYLLFELESGQTRELPLQGQLAPDQIVWSPDARFLSYLEQSMVFSDGDLPVLDLERAEVRVITPDDYSGSSWDLPDGVYADQRPIWVDSRRLVFQRMSEDAGYSVWMAEVEDPDDWVDGEVDLRPITANSERGVRLWEHDRYSGRIYVMSMRPLDVTGLRHTFQWYGPGDAEPAVGPEGEPELSSSPSMWMGVVPGRPALVVIPPSEVVGDEVGPQIPPAILDLETGDLHTLLPDGVRDELRDVAVAPDGSSVVLVHDDARSGRLHVSLRRLSGTRPSGPLTTLYRSDGPSEYPFWRPFSGGSPMVLWAADGRIVFVESMEGRIVELELVRR